jgi:hypothetical protein
VTGRLLGKHPPASSWCLPTGGDPRRQGCWEAGQSSSSYPPAKLGGPGGAEHSK